MLHRKPARAAHQRRPPTVKPGDTSLVPLALNAHLSTRHVKEPRCDVVHAAIAARARQRFKSTQRAREGRRVLGARAPRGALLLWALFD